MKKLLISTIYSLLFFTLSFAQQPNLPHYPTPEEGKKMQAYLSSFQSESRFSPDPPPTPVRTMAEWEEVQALVITWTGQTGILTEIVRHAVNECKVIIVTQNQSNVANALQLQNIPLDNVEFIDHDFNSIWIRDYGPWTVYQNDVDTLALADWIYNRPRPLDDIIPSAIADHLNLPIYEAISSPYDWVHTGGNHLRDGMGTAFSSELVFAENPDKSEAEIDQIANTFLGVDQYIKFPVLPYDGIHHLDMHMRVIDEETIFFGEYPEGVADGPQIEANIQYLKSQFTTPFGNQYNIVRLPMPPDQFDRYPDENGHYRTFTNSLFINKTILVPIYEEQYDTTALRIYRENLPGYNVVGINCNAIIPSLGALHCITKMVGTNDPLWIAHPRLRDTYDDENDYEAIAKIKHISGITDATVYYTTDTTEAYAAIEMTLTDPDNDMWSASIPAQEVGTHIYYYIHATANSGKEQVRPIVAPEGYFRFKVKAIDAPPIAEFFIGQSALCANQSLEFTDLSSGAVTEWSWSFPGGEPAASDLPNPIITYTEPGTYDVTLTVSNALGESTQTITEAITVEAGVAPSFQDFSTEPFDPWTIVNPSNDNAIWTSVELGDCYGNGIRMDNFTDDTRGTSDFVRARFNLEGQENTHLTFDVAYAPYNGNFFDALRVNIIDCEGQATTVYNKSGETLGTAPAIEAAFVPNGCEEWRSEAVDISAYDGQTIIVEFENVGGYGNMLYLDNIDFGGPNIGPSVELVSPEGGTYFVEVFPIITLEAEASDPDGQITFVTFFLDGDSIGIATEMPYTMDYQVLELGSHIFSARATDNNGAEAVSSTVEVVIEILIDTDDPSHISGLQLDVFPNPAKEKFTLQVNSSDYKKVQFRVVDILGRTVHNEAWNIPNGQSFKEFSSKNLASGTYFIILSDQKVLQRKKVLILD